MNENKLQDEILSLISSKQEGIYWDFKREWYEFDSCKSKARLCMLMDIICMANNVALRDAYIIFGINEDNDYHAYNIINSCNRRKTLDIQNFLNAKKFAGDFVPQIRIETIEYESLPIDVMIIQHSHNTPYYLETVDNIEGKLKKYQLYPYRIYTRDKDGNTPHNKSGNVHHIELLWKNRFHLLDSVNDRFQYYLKNTSEWKISPQEDKDILYCKNAPEYIMQKIKDDEYENRDEFFVYHQYDDKATWGTITLQHSQTEVEKFTTILLDEWHYETIFPEVIYINIIDNQDNVTSNNICCYNFVKGTLRYSLFEFFNNYQNVLESFLERKLAYQHFCECIMMFNSNDEKNQFITFVAENWYYYKAQYKVKDKFNLCMIENKISINKQKVFCKRFNNMQILKKMYSDFICL